MVDEKQRELLREEAQARHREAVSEMAKEKAEQKRYDQEIKIDYANPAKAREDMDKRISEYYTNSARELMIVLKCYMNAGFTRTEAFEIAKLLVPNN